LDLVTSSGDALLVSARQEQSTIERVYSNGFCVEGYITEIISITLRLLGVQFSKDGEAMHGQEVLQ
jgi:hypothetical protein